jgi:hypothetical protein
MYESAVGRWYRNSEFGESLIGVAPSGAERAEIHLTDT